MQLCFSSNGIKSTKDITTTGGLLIKSTDSYLNTGVWHERQDMLRMPYICDQSIYRISISMADAGGSNICLGGLVTNSQRFNCNV